MAASVTASGGDLLVLAYGPEATRVGWVLRQALGGNVTRRAGGGYLVGAQAARTVLDLLPDANWDDDARKVVERVLDNRDRQLAARLEIAEALQDPAGALQDYLRLWKLDPHQVEAVAAATVPSLRGMAIWDEQGVGKTAMALCAFDLLAQRGVVQRLLVLAPKSVLGSWAKDAANILDGAYRFVMIDGSATKRRDLWKMPHDIVACGYETAVSDASKLQQLLSLRPGRYMLILDESYYVKNPATRRSEVVGALRPYCERALVLCGTPAPNSARDLVNQIQLTDGGASLGGRVVPEDEGAMREFVEAALDDTIYIRRLKHEVLPDLPEKAIEVLRVPLRPVQQALYETTLAELADAVRGVDDRRFQRELASFMARRAALLQICSHPGALDPTYEEVPAKLLALDHLIQDFVLGQGEKLVIWSYFRFSLEQIAGRYSSHGLVRVDGTVSSLRERIEAIRRFQTDPDVRLFLGNAAAAGAGITLTAARYAVYESFSNQAAHWLQSMDRIHRRGQDRDVICHALLADGTLEVREFRRLRDKERAARDLLGDRYDEPMTRERFLADLKPATDT